MITLASVYESNVNHSKLTEERKIHSIGLIYKVLYDRKELVFLLNRQLIFSLERLSGRPYKKGPL